MRVKVDENLPAACVGLLSEFGHEAATAAEQGLSGKPDAALLAACTSEKRLLLTLDRGFGDIRMHPPGSHQGIVVLRLGDQRTLFVLQALRAVLENHRLDELQGCIAVVQRGMLRIRWPEPGLQEQD